MSQPQSTGIADLTPHQWSTAEHTHARVAVQCAIQGNFARMEEHLRGLPRAALVDLQYALDVMHPLVRLLAMTREKVLVERAERSLISSSRHVDGNDRVPVPCGRCGHDERNEDSVTEFVARTGVTTSVTYCPSCPDGICQPVLVPIGASAQTVTVDGEDIVE